MAKACWKQIGKLESSIEDNDPAYLHEFIDILAANGLLTGFMLTLLCECRYSSRDASRAYDLLHKFASDK